MRTKTTTNDDLRHILREGDPAAADPGLQPDEVQALRRAVLTTVPEPARRRAWLPLLAAGTAAAVAVVLALVLVRGTRAPGSPAARPAPPRVAALPEAPTVIVAPEPVPEPAPKPAKPGRARRHRTLPAAPAAEVVAALPEPPPATATRVREIQFSTPGGTRIIWELTGDETR